MKLPKEGFVQPVFQDMLLLVKYAYWQLAITALLTLQKNATMGTTQIQMAVQVFV